MWQNSCCGGRFVSRRVPEWPSTLFSVSPSTKSSVKNFSTVEDFCLLEYDAVYPPVSVVRIDTDVPFPLKSQTARRRIPQGVFFIVTAMRSSVIQDYSKTGVPFSLTNSVNISNLLKPTCHVMNQQFNIKHFYALPTLYLWVLYLSENKQRLVPLRA